MNQLLLIISRMAGVFFISFLSFSSSAQTNYGLSFDGTNDYVSISHNSALNLSGNLTFEAWVNLNSTAAMYTILSKGDGNNNSITNYIFNVGNNNSNGKLSLMIAGAWYTSSLTLSINTWYHCAVTVAGNTVSFFVNGIAAGTSTISGSVYSSGTYTLKLGEQGDGCACNRMNGKMDEVRIWNVARTQAEIKAGMFNKSLSGSAGGLVAYYRFNEGSGTNAGNSCTNTAGIDGTLTNGPLYSASPIQFGGNALSFDGANDYVSVPDNNNLDITTNITLEAWVYATKSTGVQNVVSKSSNSINTGYIFPRTDNGWSNVVLYLNIGGWKTLSAAYPSLNAWHHLAATYDGATMKIYIDGTLSASSAQTGSIATNSNALTLGNQTGYSEYFGGSADEIRVWNVTRTQSEIQNSMNSELDPASQTGLVSYYTANQGIAGGTNTGLTTLIDQKGNNNGTLNGLSLTGSTSNFVTQNSGLSILPLKWLSFSAQKQYNGVLLQWSTASETNTSDFWIEHSVNAKSWRYIGSVSMAANGNDTRSYSYMHNASANGVNYYRIRQNDRDGKYSYSKIRSILVNNEAGLFEVISNPVFSKMLQLQINAITQQTFTLFNSDGKMVWVKEFSPGIHTVDLSREGSGIYMLRSGGHTKKLIVQ